MRKLSNKQKATTLILLAVFGFLLFWQVPKIDDNHKKDDVVMTSPLGKNSKRSNLGDDQAKQHFDPMVLSEVGREIYGAYILN